MAYFDPGYFTNTRSTTKRVLVAPRTIRERLVAWELDSKYYDGDRNFGYGGYKYQRERWHEIVRKVFGHFGLKDGCKVLDLGCKKGFFLQAVKELYPSCNVLGIENHEYPLICADESVKNFLSFRNYYDLLEFSDGEFDFVWAFSSIYMQNLGDVVKTLREIQRISGGTSFITLGAYDSLIEKTTFEKWTLLGTTILSPEEWSEVFDYSNYRGDWFFTTPKILGLT